MERDLRGAAGLFAGERWKAVLLPGLFNGIADRGKEEDVLEVEVRKPRGEEVGLFSSAQGAFEDDPPLSAQDA